MKFFAHLLMLFLALCLALLLVTAEDMEKCDTCFEQKAHDVCGKNRGYVYTVYNLCVLQCYQYEFLYDGRCSNEDLKNNQLEEK